MLSVCDWQRKWQCHYIPARMELLNTYNKKLQRKTHTLPLDLIKAGKRLWNHLSEFGQTKNSRPPLHQRTCTPSYFLSDSAIADLEQAIDFPGISRQTQAECKLELGDILLVPGNVWDSGRLYAQVDKDFPWRAVWAGSEIQKRENWPFSRRFSVGAGSAGCVEVCNFCNWLQTMLCFFLISGTNGIDSATDAPMLYSKADLLSYRNKNDEALATLGYFINPTFQIILSPDEARRVHNPQQSGWSTIIRRKTVCIKNCRRYSEDIL